MGPGWLRRTVDAGYPRLLPVPVGLAADGGHVALDVAMVTLVPHQGVDLIAVLLPAKGPGVLHYRWVPTGNCRRWAKTIRDGETLADSFQPVSPVAASPVLSHADKREWPQVAPGVVQVGY